MTQKTLTMIGPFTDTDLAYLLAALRYCEQQQPDQKFFMTIESNDSRPVEDMKEFLKDKFPCVQGVPVTVETFNRD